VLHRNIYTLEDPSDSESRVLSYLQHFTLGTPDSETYATPQCSPSDSKDYGFCEESCEELHASLGRSSAHYYSLVPLDDVCKPSDLLEQELEEQDELIRSFQSIKENTQVKKPSYLQLSSRQTKNSLFQTKQQTCSVIEEVNTESEDVLLSCISSPCSLITPDMDPSSRTMDSGVDCGLPVEDHTMSISHPSSSSLPRDLTDTSGVDDCKQNNCTTMASISDAESDHEFPDESAELEKSTPGDSAVSKEKIDIAEKKTNKSDGVETSQSALSDSVSSMDKEKIDVPEKKTTAVKYETPQLNIEEFDTVKLETDSKPVKTSDNSNIKVAEKLIGSISVSCHVTEMPDKTFNVRSKQIVSEAPAESHDTPFCLVTSIEEFEASQIVLQDTNKAIVNNPQFITYDVNRSSNRNSGNFFIDASSLLDESEMCSGDWLQEKVHIAGVTTSSTDDHEMLDSNKYTKDSLQERPSITAVSTNELFIVEPLKSDKDKILKEKPIAMVSPAKKEAACEQKCTPTRELFIEEPFEMPKSSKEIILKPEEASNNITINTHIVASQIIHSEVEPKRSEHDEKLVPVLELDTKISENKMICDLSTEVELLKLDVSVNDKPQVESVMKSCDKLSGEDSDCKEVDVMQASDNSEILSKSSIEPVGRKLETSVIDHVPKEKVELGTCPSVDMIRSAPAAVSMKLQDDRPRSLDCSQLQPLPRRNTFELEADGKQLIFMRQESEKKQGQLLFQNCIPAFSQHVTGSEGQISGNKIPFTPPPDPIPDFAMPPPVQPFSLAIPATEEEINTPDSLNNDGPLENMPQDNIIVNETSKPNRIEPRKQKYDESMPILSGGLCTADFEVHVKESPQTRRRNESAPIMSGANMDLMDTPTSSPRLPRKIDATAWVVDMSDPNDVKSPEVRRKRRTILPSQLETVKTSEPETEIIRRKNQALGFFVDLSDSESKKKPSPPPQQPAKPPSSGVDADKKKSFFSMYVDIGENKAKAPMPKRLERRVYSRETSREDEQSKVEQSSEGKEETSKEKQGFYMFIEAEPPVVRRQTVSGGKSNVNRHSWNVEPKPSEEVKKHKRTQSLSIDGSFNYEDLQKQDVKVKLSTQSLTEEAQTIKPKVEYSERSEVRVMTRSMDETLTTEVKMRTGRAELEPVMESAEARKQFVRLSDMDGRVRHEMRQPGDGRARTRKVEETSWIESKLMVRGSRTMGTSFASCHSPTQDTDESELSSMQSSVDRSGLGKGKKM
jgi:hypothetical protein